jgi:Putative Actinobacterial Holin-X, holin superfamily III
VNNLFREVSNRVDRIFKSMVFAAAAGAAAIASLFFFSLAAFLLLQLWYGTLWASVFMGIVYALIALAALITVLPLGSKKPRPQAPPPPKPVWQDPLVVSSALQLVKSMRPRTLLTLAAVGAFVAGLVLTGQKNKPTDRSTDQT